MSQFLEPNRNMLSHPCLVEEAYFYILNKFRANFSLNMLAPPTACTCCSSRQKIETELVEHLMENLGPEKRMYGSPKELLENLKIFKSFPGNRQLFSRGAETYQIPAKIYMSLKYEPYIYKPDLYAMLQNMALYIAPPGAGREVEMMIVYYLKAQEEEINGFPEFVKFDQKMFDEMVVELQKGFYEEAHSPQQLADWEEKYSKMNIGEIIEDFKALIPYSWENPDRLEVFQKTFEHIWSTSVDSAHRAHVLARRYSLSNLMIYSLSMLINRKPDFFFPNFATDPHRRAMKTCRVFEEGNRKFLMKWELSEAILTEKGRSFDSGVADFGGAGGNDRNVYTIPLNEARRKYETRGIEFIQYPIFRTKHRAIPIKSQGSSQFCLLAVDALFDVLRELIHGIKIFQKCPILEQPKLWAVFKRYEQFHYLPDMKDPYFIPLDSDQCVLNTLRTFLGVDVVDSDDVNVNVIRDSEDFSAQNLKDELQYLGLVAIFPEIENHAEIVYSEVFAAKKEPKLRTCDMYDAVEHCQLICIFDRLPNYKKFLHNQQACHRIVGLHCDACDPEKENQKTSTSSGQIQKPMENLKF